MALFKRKARDKPQDRTAGSSYSFFMGGSSAGKSVTERSAMQMTAVYSCVRILAEAVAGLPLHFYKYNEDGSKTKAIDTGFSNIEQQSLEFVKYTLDPWIIRWEQSLNRSLLNPDEKKTYFFKFNVEGLLRGDYQSRMQGYATARQNGWMSANDIRELENLDKIPAEEGGDLYLINGNMLPLNKAGAYANKEKEEEADEEVLELDKGTKQRNGRKSTRT